MAFVSGYDTEYRCRLCDEKVSRTINKTGGIGMLGFSLIHDTNGIVMINGYPSACPNNGKSLEQDQAEKVSIPIIESDWRTMSY